MYISNKFLVSSLILAVSSAVNATPTKEYPRVAINSQQDFCLFLPPAPGLEVAVNEDNGIPFCTHQDTVYNATLFPEGFITTAHYLKNTSYVQITGYFDRDKYNLSATDGGGQYDNHANGKPIGAQCENYKYFVSMIEPDIDRFCIRCCQYEEDCITGRSAYGCLRIIDGDYTNDNNYINNSTNTSTTTSHLNTNMNSVLVDVDQLSPTTPKTANDAIALKVQQFEKYTNVDQIKQEWNAFVSDLLTQYPQVSDQINQLKSMTSSFTTLDQWKSFFNLVAQQIVQLQSSSSAPTTTTQPTTSNTYTYTKEDLDWLFNHRNEHDNQATW